MRTAMILGILALSIQAAGAATLDATSWIDADDPIKENQSGTSTTGLGFVNIAGNGDLAVVSDYDVTAPFNFGGTITAPEDDDILGLVFGYEDGFNNYRISWTGGEDHDWEAGRAYGGLMLVAEQGGVAETLFRDEDLLWQAGVSYDFKLDVYATALSFRVRVDDDPFTSFLILGDFSDVDGSIGVFTRSNPANFTNLTFGPPDVSPLMAAVPLPPAMPLLLGGIGGLWWLRRRRATV